MAFLSELNVKKVSFVNRAANKRKFLLLKSDDHGDQKIEKEQEHEEESTIMKDEIRKSVRLLLKSGTSDEKIVETLKAEYKLTDPEIAEVKNSLDFARSVVTPDAAKPEVKKQDPEPEPDPEPEGIRKDLEEMRKENAAMREAIQKDTENRMKSEIRKWLSDNCTHLPADSAQITEDIFKMQQTNPEGADRLKQSLKASSEAVRNSFILVEKGSSYDASPVPMGNTILQKVRTSLEEIRKSGNNVQKGSDVISDAVKSLGSAAYKQYRAEHNYRAKHS